MQRYPLTWPVGWKRTSPPLRQSGRFNKKAWQYNHEGRRTWQRSQALSIQDATRRVLRELRALGAEEGAAIISTNLRLRLDGLPRSDQREPDDPGVAVYWQRPADQTHKVMAIDLYDRVADNLAAVAATLEAMRAIERHGGALILERAFTGFEALPAPRDWRVILGVAHLDRPSLEVVQQQYRQKAKALHPDQGGHHDLMADLNWAWEQAQRELGD